MSRRRRARKRNIVLDAKYQHGVVSKLINCMMKGGKKSTAETIVYHAIDNVSEKLSADSIDIFEEIIDNIRPVVEVRSRRVGGATYQVPVEVRADRSIALALRWLIKSSRSRSGKNMQEKLAAEMLDAYNKRGSAVKKKEDTHKMAEANKAFSHYRW